MNTMERKQLAGEKTRQMANALASAIELMAGESVSAAVSEGNAAAVKGITEPLVLKCTFGFTDAPLWMTASGEGWGAIASAAVAGAGIEEADDDLRKQTWQELLTQGAGPLIADRMQDPSAKVTLAEAPAGATEGTGEVFAVEVSFGNKTFPRLFVEWAPALLDAFRGEEETGPQAVGQAVPPTLDRLLDVELPLSVSFGRTILPVNDILKLGSGSIVELNCPANDLVDIVVNNCMIARGEVVVIEGNYGVRIREIISRTERMALQNVKGPLRLSA